MKTKIFIGTIIILLLAGSVFFLWKKGGTLAVPTSSSITTSSSTQESSVDLEKTLSRLIMRFESAWKNDNWAQLTESVTPEFAAYFLPNVTPEAITFLRSNVSVITKINRLSDIRYSVTVDEQRPDGPHPNIYYFAIDKQADGHWLISSYDVYKPAASAEATETEIYVNKELGFAFEHANNLMITSEDTNFYKSQPNYAFLSISSTPRNKYFARMIVNESVEFEMGPDSVPSSISTTTISIGGVTGEEKVTDQGTSKDVEITFTHGQDSYYLRMDYTTLEQQSISDQIIKSFRFTK